MSAPIDVTHLTAGGVKITHHDGPLTTDGPFIILHSQGRTSDFSLIIAAHALVHVTPCEGACHADG